MLELCRDRVDGNSNENGVSTMDNDCCDVQEVECDDIIDGGLEVFLDLYDNEFEKKEMINDNNDKCDENDNDYFYNQFKGWGKVGEYNK